MSHHLHMTNWMAVGSNVPKKEKQLVQQVLLKKPTPTDAYKTVMCQAWLESKTCFFADKCRFAHGEADLRPSKVVPALNRKYKTKLCDKYTTSGLCPYGSRCLFIHPDNGNDAYIRPDKLVEIRQRHDRKASWPIESDISKSAKTEEEDSMLDIHELLECFEPATTPNRVSLASGLSGYASGVSSPYSTISSSSINLTTDDEYFERDFFRITGLEHLAEELTRNLTTTDLW